MTFSFVKIEMPGATSEIKEALLEKMSDKEIEKEADKILKKEPITDSKKLSPKQKKLDLDDNEKIDAEDLKGLRKKSANGESETEDEPTRVPDGEPTAGLDPKLDDKESKKKGKKMEVGEDVMMAAGKPLHNVIHNGRVIGVSHPDGSRFKTSRPGEHSSGSTIPKGAKVHPKPLSVRPQPVNRVKPMTAENVNETHVITVDDYDPQGVPHAHKKFGVTKKIIKGSDGKKIESMMGGHKVSFHGTKENLKAYADEHLGGEDQVKIKAKNESVSKIRRALLDVVEKKEHGTPKNKDTWDSKFPSGSAQKMRDDVTSGKSYNTDETEKMGHSDDLKATRVSAAGGKTDPRSNGDAIRGGDQKIIPPGTKMKDPGAQKDKKDPNVDKSKPSTGEETGGKDPNKTAKAAKESTILDRKIISNITDAYNSMHRSTVDEGIGKLIKKGIEKLKPYDKEKDPDRVGSYANIRKSWKKMKDEEHMHYDDKIDKKRNENSHTELSMYHQNKARELKDAGKHEEAKHHDAAAVAHTEAAESASKNNDKVDEKLSNASHLASSKANGGKKFEHLHQTVAQGRGVSYDGDKKDQAHNHPLARDAIRANGISQPEDTKTVVKRNAGMSYDNKDM